MPQPKSGVQDHLLPRAPAWRAPWATVGGRLSARIAILVVAAVSLGLWLLIAELLLRVR